MADTRISLGVPGVSLVAVADLYDGRLKRAKEIWGNSVFTTRDHREVLARKDVDAVIIGTPDHWHAQITKEALAAGKHVYCEKPMVHDIAEGQSVIAAQQSSGRVLQIGSQYVSSLVYQKARELMQSGAIGELNMVEAYLDRNTAIGAWQYSIPPDASPSNIDWDRFLGNAPKRPFEPIRLFRWRNYRDYGTGVAGDLFVHLLSGLHVVTGSIGPKRVYAAGGVRFWDDGRDVPDVMLATMDYPKTAQHPEFTLALRVNFASGVPDENFGFRFVGSEGVMTTSYSTVKLAKEPRESEPGYTVDTFPKAAQKQIIEAYRAKYPRKPLTAESIAMQGESRYSTPPGYDSSVHHQQNFYDSVRNHKPSIEDGVFGLRAAGPALLTNKSYFDRTVCSWDPVRMA
jgi:predicted dehydrogenase